MSWELQSSSDVREPNVAEVNPKLWSPVNDDGMCPYENDLGAVKPDVFGDMLRQAVTSVPDPMGYASGGGNEPPTKKKR